MYLCTVLVLCSALRNVRSPLWNVCSALRNIRSAVRNIKQKRILSKSLRAIRYNIDSR